MIRRILFVVALSACAVIAGGVAAWSYHVSAISAILDDQAAAAKALLKSNQDPVSVLAAIGRPEITAIFHDHESGMHYEWRDGEIVAPPGPGPFGAPPPENGGFQPPPPLPHSERREASRPPLAYVAAILARIPPRHVEAGDVTLTLLPAIHPLGHWLLADILTCALALFLLCVAAWVTGSVLTRAAREPLVKTTLALEALAAGDFVPQTVQAGIAPEIARLARAYNAAAETVARSIEERRAAAAEFQRFLADAGHELRTPLTIVGGYIDILKRYVDPGDPTGRRVIEGMGAEMERMRGLVEKMLLLSRMESAVSEPRDVAVASVTDDVAEAMRAGYPGRTIDVQVDERARIRIDEDDLYEAERNLVENALRHAPGSPVEVAAAVADGQVVIEVTDRGPGIPEQEQPLIFERFYRGSGTKTGGSGLGLAIVRRVVERWGGSIALASDANGTRFSLRFPLAGAEGART